MSAEEKIEIHRGLKGVYFERSGTTFIDGKAGELRYRGYSIHDLAQHSSFEETAYLLLHGELPTAAQLSAFDAGLKAARRLPPEIVAIIETVKRAHPMDVLRTAVSALAAFDAETQENSVEATRAKGMRLAAQVPMIVAAHEALRNGRSLPEPDQSLSHAANFLWMITGRKPSPEGAQLMDRDLILHAEHGSNASSFAARVVVGTEANLHAAVTAAIAALSGPAHGGAAEDVMRMAQEIGEPERAAAYVKAKRAAGEAVTGFGHRVYRTEDPRARHMREGVEKLSREMGEPKWFAILQSVVDAMKPYARFGVNVNVDFYSGAIYYLNGIAADLFVPIFAVGRVPGWTVQCIEQLQNNILIRPLTLYDGPQPRAYVPLTER
ncbi:citrate/2-methylcitrate synthase [Aestuariivirga sp.]|uniref:citrate/2-methylcitrate synthase n=1 Tax=Aestuariivirga sp. TaxID=2650926 RepID=UPI00391CF6B7